MEYLALDDSAQETNLVTSPNNLTMQVDSHDLRDSGISMTENHLNNFNNTCYEDFDLRSHQTEMNINNSPHEDSPKIENPPPIPPKSCLASTSLNSSLDLGSSLERPRRRDNTTSDIVTPPENYSLPKIHKENGTPIEKKF
ncbi:hypothetical protein NQ314_018310 [Rhamnusium bicolor]|uniref:Uncharacterized protein n=1 Tax=Rhamnusium bicolor TaxID=1586634 RepID=A0AAV8WRH6_9CUCU|nr:hypothetical protein NQ314_018310 [Rhamnusium bicolor]